MKFVMMAFSDEVVQKQLIRLYREKTGVTEPLSFKEYVEWVRSDSVEESAAVFEVMECLHSFLELESFGLETEKGKKKNAFAVY